mgnify:FL=1|jgi:hypothetical protein|nr:MAG TPA: hypothetical protein [Bacteriophage sp.]DAO25902.1 MAG TPA: hypothetical protein [Caudoviricetes sp.]
MPSLQTARRIANAKTNDAKTLGQIYKEESDFLMEETWDNSVTSKTCYIYDYFHDDFFTDEHGITRSLAEGMTYENTNKTKIDAKFIIKSYQSMDKDQVEYYLMFRPSQPVRFNEGDDLYYYETDFRKRYSATFPIGLWVDLPDDRGVYHKWLICRNEPANQFPKYLILPANYELMWVEKNNEKRIKRRMWCVLRQQMSYTSGVYVDRVFGHTDNQNKLILPMNSITEKFWYTDDDSKNMRVIVSALMENPTVWKITKCESASPLGLQKLTLYTNFFNEHTDYVNLETGEMYANYFDSEITPIDPSTPTTPPSSITAKISASTSTIKVGGSYKNLTVNLFNDSNEDITTEYTDATFTWTCSVDDEDWTDKVTWRVGTEYNQKKVKFPNDSSVIGKILSVKCKIVKDDLSIESEILPLELTE